MSPTRRERQHAATLAEIKEVAWQQIAANGAPALSLRAIARAMGMTAPALYRYFPSRDDLVTALIVDAYNSLAEALESARAAHALDAHAARLRAAGTAYRNWALAHPQRYALIFGTPIPGYEAPAEITTPAAARSLNVLIEILAAAYAAGHLHPQGEFAALPGELAGRYRAFAESRGAELPPEVLHMALASWLRLHGLVSLELDGHFEALLGSADPLFEQLIDGLAGQFGLQSESQTNHQ